MLSPTLSVYDGASVHALRFGAPALFLTLIRMSRVHFREDMQVLYLIAIENQMCELYALTHPAPIIIPVYIPVDE